LIFSVASLETYIPRPETYISKLATIFFQYKDTKSWFLMEESIIRKCGK
jgi:hypothetical protein